MKISVVIPTFNRAEHIARAVQSVLNQTLQPCEVLVVDDGSTDGTGRLLRKKFPTVKVIKQGNSGVSAARNRGIMEATGDWVGFLDSDDEWMPKKLSRQACTLSQHPGHDISHTDEIWIRNNQRVNPKIKHAKPNGWIFENCLNLCCVSPSSILIKKSVLVVNGLFDESLPACEDYDLWLRLFYKLPILLVPEKLVIKYGGHKDQLSKQFWGMDRFRVRGLMKLLEGNSLTSEQRNMTIDMLLHKLMILINGFKKRENRAELDYYQTLYQKWSKCLC